MSRGQLGVRALRELLGDWRSEAPGYEALADRLRLLLLDGRVSADIRLPAEREFAAALQLSRTTVAAAYRRLREAGYATSMRGSGTTTTLPPGRVDRPVQGEELVDFTHASLPATRLLPGVLDEVLAEYRGQLGRNGYDSVGLPRLRAEIAAWYTRRGLPTDAEQLIVTTGAQSAIALSARAIIARGDRVWAESPSYPNAYDALREAGGRVVTSPVAAEDGWDLDALEAAFRRTAPTLAYTMPDFQNPTGRSMTAEDRDRLLEAAAAARAVVLADETTAEMDIDRGARNPPLAAQAEEHGAEVVHIGSASKSLWGGLRIGWVRGSAQLLHTIAAQRGSTDLALPVFEQLMVARLLPLSAEIAEERRAQLRAGRDAARAAVAQLLPDWSFPPAIDGGLAAWVKLAAPVSSQLALAARSRGLLVAAGPRFGVDGAFERNLRIPITAEPAELWRGVEILAELWPSVSGMARAGFEGYAGTVA